MDGRDLRRAPAPTSREFSQARRLIAQGLYMDEFCVLGHVSRLFPGEGLSEWQLVVSPAQDIAFEGDVLTRDQAMDIIRVNGMERTGSFPWGRVYEKQGSPFRSRWRGYYSTRELASVWPRLAKLAGAPEQMLDPRIWAEATDTEFVIHAPVEAAEFVRWACRVRVAAALPLAVVAGDRRIVFGEVEG